MRRADATPHAAALIEGLRDIGYSLETALADVIDNSITAGAHLIDVLTDTSTENPHIAILDNGHGMTEAELIAAMRPGSRNPLAARDEPDLGRFGLGLKSASFSQCRRLTVATRKGANTSAAIWDLDDVANTNQWAVQLPSDVSHIPYLDRLGDTGTVVVWEKLDRLGGGGALEVEKQAAIMNQKVAQSERHLRLVFHRFMEKRSGVKLRINGRLLQPLDPFVLDNKATFRDPEETFNFSGSEIAIQSYTLPHHKQMPAKQWDDVGGPEGHLKTQGIYLYRANRLIIHGTWFGLCRQSELTKLTRVRIDIPNNMDADWKIDVKKSSAQLPPVVRERLRKITERILDGSKKTYRKRGQKLVDENRLPIWHRVQADGEIRYRPNIDHPAFVSFAATLPPEMRRGFYNCVALVGAALPVEALQADMAGMAESIVPEKLDDDTLVQAVRSTVAVLRGASKSVQEIRGLMRDVDPFRSAWDATQLIIDEAVLSEGVP